MIELIVPAGVATNERYGDTPGVIPLAEEAAAVAGAIAARQAEFASARACARDALKALGVMPAPIPVGPDRAPRWPAGVIGSITHCIGYRAAAVAQAKRFVAVGIDAEPNVALPGDVRAVVASQAELRVLPTLNWLAADRLLFSAKESVYKAWYPWTRRWLDFSNVDIRLSINGNARPVVTGTLLARIGVDCPAPSMRTLSGRWLATDELVVTAVIVSR